MRTRSPSRWEGCGTQEGAGGREQVTLGKGGNAIQRGKGELMAKAKGCDQIGRVRREDLTWGSRMPQDRLYTV